MKRAIIRICFSVVVLGLGLTQSFGVHAQQATNEEFARRQYDSGVTFLQNHRYVDGLKDLQAVVDSFATTSIADNALLQIAQYHIDVARDARATQAAIDKLLKDYPDTDSAPMAHVVSGRLALTRGRAAADVDTAMAGFERVLRLFPGSDAVPAAGFYAGETLRIVRRTDDALDRFRRVTMEYPRSPWAARAALSAGYCLVQQEKPHAAMQQIQWVRQQFPNMPVAVEALNLNTIIYRLYVRQPAQPTYGFSGKGVGNEQANYRDVMGVLIDSDGRVLLGHKGGVAIFDKEGAASGAMAAVEPSAFFLDEKNRVVAARGGSLLADRGETLSLAVPTQDGRPRPLEDIPAALTTPRGDRLVADGKAKIVIRISPDGKYLGLFASSPAARMAMNGLDDVAMLDKGSKSISIADRDGKILGKIPDKGTGYELADPIDITYDTMGHLYVLDRGRASVFVFGPKNKFIASATIPEKTPGAFMRPAAFGLDPAGRLYIFDERAKRIQVYQ